MSDIRIQTSVSTTQTRNTNTTQAGGKNVIGGQRVAGTDFSRVLGMNQTPAQAPQTSNLTTGPASSTTSSVPAHAIIATAIANGMQMGNSPRKIGRSKLGNSSSSGLDDVSSSSGTEKPSELAGDASLNDARGPFADIVNLAGTGNTQAKLMLAQKRMAELNEGLNTQYLMMQQMMQQENREYNTLTNVLKAKTESVKGILKNIA